MKVPHYPGGDNGGACKAGMLKGGWRHVDVLSDGSM